MSDEAPEKKEDERTCPSWQCANSTPKIFELSDDRYMCLNCGCVVHPSGMIYFGESSNWDLQNNVQSLEGYTYSVNQFFADLPRVVSDLYKEIEKVSAVNRAILDELRRLTQRLEKHEASHGAQQDAGVEEEKTVDDGEKADPGGEESSSS